MKAYAKVNLSLDVTGKLGNGYHTLRSVMQTVDLFDEVFVATAGGGGADGVGARISVDMRPDGVVYAGKDNLAYRAAALMLERFAPAGAAAPRDIYISIHKHIPVAAGLAGGSTDAAAVMLALADEWNIEADLSQLCAISVSIGADVPFSLAANAKNNAGRYAADPMASSTALAEGIGDILTPLPAPPGAIILVKPNLSLSTARIYCVYDRAPEKAARPDTDGFLRYLRSGKPTAGAPTETTAPLVTHMVNALQYAAASESPETASLIGDLANALPAAKVFLSGSGPTVAAYFQDRAEAEAALPAVRKRFERDGTRVFLPIILA